MLQMTSVHAEQVVTLQYKALAAATDKVPTFYGLGQGSVIAPQTVTNQVRA